MQRPGPSASLASIATLLDNLPSQSLPSRTGDALLIAIWPVVATSKIVVAIGRIPDILSAFLAIPPMALYRADDSLVEVSIAYCDNIGAGFTLTFMAALRLAPARHWLVPHLNPYPFCAIPTLHS
jgi:hypothetical protein